LNNTGIIREIKEYLDRLFPIYRSITGQGNRETLETLQEIAPINIVEYPSGTEVYDWKIPDEWQVSNAWIEDVNGSRIVDFHENNVHLVGYSTPVDKSMNFQDLKGHLHVHGEIPEAIPYRTSYYEKNWGFCVKNSQYLALKQADGPLHVKIESSFNSHGSLTIGELLISGKSEKEILISTYMCHPSLANDNLSGVLMTAFLARELLKKDGLQYSYRIIWVPETIGAVSYCSMNEASMKEIDVGFVITTVGGPGDFGYKQSYDDSHEINSIVERAFKARDINFLRYPFDIHGSDERQYSSQGFRINIVSITKDKYYEYPYYHTSFDNLDFVKAEYIFQSLEIYLDSLNFLESDFGTWAEPQKSKQLDVPVYRNNYPYCEVMLSKHNLYPVIGGGQLPKVGDRSELDLILWLLFWCDGSNTLRDVARKLGVGYSDLEVVAKKLLSKEVLSFG